MRLLALPFLAAFVCFSSSARAENRAATYAALYLYGVLSSGMATIQICRDADMGKAASYDAMLGKFLGDNFATYGRIDEVLTAEGARSGQGSTYFTDRLPTTMAFAKMLATGNRDKDSAKFILMCRALLVAADRKIGYFAPLQDRYPAETRALDEWR